MSLQLLQNKSTILPKKGHQKDQYTGQIHPQTKRRHGKGTYIYKNKYFSYQGQYIQGKKHGQGILKLADSTQIQAYFLNDQIQGSGKIIYPDSSLYIGQFHLGQKHGKGLYESIYQKYSGDYIQNRKQGYGIYENLSIKSKYQGQFKNDKYEGKGKLVKYNYQYEGEWINGKKEGNGVEVSQWRRQEQEGKDNNNNQNQKDKKDVDMKIINYDRYQYQGNFINDLFNGHGIYRSKSSKYQYEGQFLEGLPKNYPNEFRIYITSSIKSEIGQITESQKTLVDNNNPIAQYQIGGDAKNIYVQCVYQGPQYLDEKQLTQQQIQQMIKNWQNQNKKNKNPPPMPDFRAPKMKKPQLLLIQQQSGRQIIFILQKQTPEKQYEKMKIDYRKEILLKRQQNQKILQQMKKTQDQDPKKKGGKKDPKGENELKVNLFKQKPSVKQQKISINTLKGACYLQKFQLPDDFPLGKYYLSIISEFKDFGNVRSIKIQFNVKLKQAVAKKK